MQNKAVALLGKHYERPKKRRYTSRAVLTDDEICTYTKDEQAEATRVVSENINEQNDSQNHSFLKGAMILTVSIMIVKIMGMVFKAVFANIVSPAGNGILNIAYSIYDPLFMLATVGFPIAISRMVSEAVAQRRYKDARRIHSVSVPFLSITGIVAFVAMIIGGVFYTQFIESSESIYAIICLAPTIFFGCLMSIYRGYFEGLRNMTPTAISEIIEASVKLFLGISLAIWVNNSLTVEYETKSTLFGNLVTSSEYASKLTNGYTVAAAMIGISAGALLGFVYLLLRYKIKGDGITKLNLQASPPAKPRKVLFKTLALTALPIGANSIVLSLANFIDMGVITTRILHIMDVAPNALQTMYAAIPAKEFLADPQTGEYSIQTYLSGCYGYASTLMMLIVAVTQVFGTSALPSITSAWTKGNKPEIKRSIETVLRTTTFVTLPTGLGMSVLAPQLLSLIYLNPDNAVAVDIASTVLRVMGISVIFIATATPICSMLQAVGRVDLPLKLMSIGMVMKIAINYLLVGIPSINIQGAAVGSLVAYLFVCVVGIYFLCKETKILPNFVSIFIKPLVGALFCAVAAYAGYGLLNLVLPSAVSTILAVVVAAIVYIVVMLLIRAITKEDIYMLPKGKKIAKTLEKHHIIR